jgi:hypothetical protein
MNNRLSSTSSQDCFEDLSVAKHVLRNSLLSTENNQYGISKVFSLQFFLSMVTNMTQSIVLRQRSSKLMKLVPLLSMAFSLYPNKIPFSIEPLACWITTKKDPASAP